MKKLFKDNKLILIVLFCFTLIVYGYFGFNSIYNIDGINDLILINKVNDFNLYLSVGRWSWALIGLIFDYYPLPLLCLIINSFFFSLTGVYIKKAFNIKKDIYVILLAMILISFPYNINAYSYSAWQFSIGITYFLSFYLINYVKNSNNYKMYMLSMFIISFIVGIYQSFLPFLVCLFVCISIDEVISTKNIKTALKRLVLYFFILLWGCILYALIVKVSTFALNIEMSTYQNANNMFNINIIDIVNNFKSFLVKVVEINKTSSFPTYIHIVLIVLSIIGLGVNYKEAKDIKKSLILILLYFMLIISPKILLLIKPYHWYHTITLISYVPLFVYTLSLLFRYLIKNKKYILFDKIVKTLVIVIIFIFVVNANKSAVMSYNATNASFSYLNRILIRAEQLEGYNELANPKKFYFLNQGKKEAFLSNKSAYNNEIGVTSSFMLINEDIIDALNVMGIDAIDGSKELNIQEDSEIYNMYSKSINNKTYYPHPESVFIYKDIIVVFMKPE